MTGLLTRRYVSLTKQAKISNGLEAITIGGVRENDKDESAALNKLIKWINELAPMAHIKDCEEETKAKFLARAVS